MASRPLFQLFRLTRNLAVAAGLTRFALPHKVYRFLKKGFRRPEATIDGHRLYLDTEDSLDLSIDPSYEAFEKALIAPFIKEGDTVLDIGANIGFYTLFFARLVGPQGKVIAFEPDPDNFNLLARNVETNGYRNVVLHRKAVADREGTTRLYLCGVNKADHRLYDSGDRRPFVEVETVRLDSFLEGEERIDFVKMDIQGAEPLALEGMRRLLERHPGAPIFLEFWPAGLRRGGSDPVRTLNLLGEFGFQIYRLDQERGAKEMVADIAEFMARFRPGGEEHVNLLCMQRNSSSGYQMSLMCSRNSSGPM